MLTWIQTHPAAAGAVALLTCFAVWCAFVGMEWLRARLDARKATPSVQSGAPEGGNPTVRMPRFR